MTLNDWPSVFCRGTLSPLSKIFFEPKMPIASLSKSVMSAAASNYQETGAVVIKNYFSKPYVTEIKAAIELLKNKDVDLYTDIYGVARTMERFVFKHKILRVVNEDVKQLLYKVTSNQQCLFKDKVNFKPPKGEGFDPHYDGVFQFTTSGGVIKNGWYEYTNLFHNCVICLDPFTVKNGALELSKFHSGGFASLLKNTKNDGTPVLTDEVVDRLDFFPILAGTGSVILFKHSCPHRSAPNYSSSDRSAIFLTYHKAEDGDFYDEYFAEKIDSINPNKADQSIKIRG